MNAILSCITESHDSRLLLLASLVCIVGIHGSSAIASHAGRCVDKGRAIWAATAIVAAGCTAWATHMVGLLAFNPGMSYGFDPILTVASLLAGVVGIGAGVSLAVGRRGRTRRFLAGMVLGLGVVALHYTGQASYVLTGYVVWNWPLVALSVSASLIVFGASMMSFVDRSRSIRRLGPPLLVFAIAILHFSGITAARLVFDPRYALPSRTVAPTTIAPIVAIVSFGLLALAVLGLRFSLAAKAAARRDHERLRELASFALEGLAVCATSTITIANRSLELLCGSPEGQLTGYSLDKLFPGIDISEVPAGEERDAQLVGLDGSILPVRIIQRQVSLGGKARHVVAVRDQRERLKTEAKMRSLAFSDTLTSWPNRARFNELLATHVGLSRSRGEHVSLLLINLDRFKQINDTLGNAVGDALLQGAAGRLSDLLNGCNMAARLGGDEFAVLIKDSKGHRSATETARLIIEAVNRSFDINEQHVHVGASIGAASTHDDADKPDALLRKAHLALRKAKSDGGNVLRWFTPALDKLAQDRQQLESDLRNALQNDQLTVHFQPLVDCRSSQIVAAEALVRWNHPERGMISPAEFIPIAEEACLIGKLGRFVLRTACEQAATWPEHVRVAVNLSPTQIRDPQLLESTLAVLRASGLSPSRLDLEITEGVFLIDEDRTLATLNALRAHGISLSIDDFGTGYSSLSYLRRFPFTKIKIDQSFVQNLPEDKESAAIVRTIVALAGALRMTTAIEGVETLEQFAFATAEGCDYVQGYYVSRPVVASEIVRLLECENRSVAA